MKTCNILLSAVATIVALSGVIPWGANASDGARAESLELNKSITRRVYEEGLNQGRFEVPYSEDFVGHGGGQPSPMPMAWPKPGDGARRFRI